MVCLGWTCNTRHPSFHCCWKKAACGSAEPEHSLLLHIGVPVLVTLPFGFPCPQCQSEQGVRCTGLSAGFLPAQPGSLSQNAAWICNQPSMLSWLTGWRGSAGSRGASRVVFALHFVPCSRMPLQLGSCPLTQPAAAPLQLTCAGFLGTCCQAESGSLLVTPTWPVGRLGPCRFPQPCQK